MPTALLFVYLLRLFFFFKFWSIDYKLSPLPLSLCWLEFLGNVITEREATRLWNQPRLLKKIGQQLLSVWGCWHPRELKCEQLSCGASRANHKSVGRLDSKVISGSGLKVRDTEIIFSIFQFFSCIEPPTFALFLRPKRRSSCRSTRSWRSRTWRLQSTTSGRSTTRSWSRKSKKPPKPRPPKKQTAPQRGRLRLLLLHLLLRLLLLRLRRLPRNRRLLLQKAPTGWTSATGSSWWTPRCPECWWTPRRPRPARTAARCWSSPSDRCRIR